MSYGTDPAPGAPFGRPSAGPDGRSGLRPGSSAGDAIKGRRPRPHRRAVTRPGRDRRHRPQPAALDPFHRAARPDRPHRARFGRRLLTIPGRLTRSDAERRCGCRPAGAGHATASPPWKVHAHCPRPPDPAGLRDDQQQSRGRLRPARDGPKRSHRDGLGPTPHGQTSDQLTRLRHDAQAVRSAVEATRGLLLGLLASMDDDGLGQLLGLLGTLAGVADLDRHLDVAALGKLGADALAELQ